MVKESHSLILLGLLTFFLFLFSLFKNIQYPLFWHDEGETVVMGQRILKYGYPKVFDGKNYLYLVELPDKKIGVKEKLDAYLGPAWGQFYFAAIGEKIAVKLENIYFKTGIIRSLFALVGLIGLILYSFLLIKLIENKRWQLIFFSGFFGLEFLSIPLILHIREVRYYPLALFLISFVFYSLIQFYFFKKTSFFFYFPLLFFSLILLFFVFPQSYFITLVFLFLSLTVDYFFHLNFKKYLKTTTPIIFSFIAIIPLTFFFETFIISHALSKYFNNGLSTFFYNFKNVFLFYSLNDLLIPTILAQGIIFTTNRQDYFHSLIGKVSLFLSGYFLFYLFSISQMPYMFNRYHIVIQPILTLIFLINIFYLKKNIEKLKIPSLYFEVLLIILSITLVIKIPLVINHFYELLNRYQGPLDFVIPYIKEKSRDPKKLIIATNYEEPSLMYYLGSRVIVGFTGYNLKKEIKLIPDIIIIRKNRPNFVKELSSFLEKADYQKISFPVTDYQVNNIPEITLSLHHLFSTPLTEKENGQLEIYWIKK